MDKNSAPPIPLDLIRNPNQKINQQNFWNRIQISEQELKNYAHHLDIIFLRSKKPLSSFQRLIMRSNFDHVGLLLKDCNNNLLFLEAIESRGVWINTWDQMKPIINEYYDEVAYRKLINPPDSVTPAIDFGKLEKFLDEVIGKKYELSFSKLFTHQ